VRGFAGLVFSVARFFRDRGDLTASLVLLTVAYTALGLTVSNLWPFQTLAGPCRGKWSGAQNCLGASECRAERQRLGAATETSLAFSSWRSQLVGAASGVFLVRTIALIDRVCAAARVNAAEQHSHAGTR
jgi:hypothetical protein